MNIKSVRVWEEIRRLNGRLSEAFEVRERVVETPAGAHPVPDVVQRLLAVEWPEEQLLYRPEDPLQCGHDEDDVELDFGGFRVATGLVDEDEPRAWYGIAVDDAQFYYLVDLVEADGDASPTVYCVDHGGGDRVREDSPSLWTLLNGMRASARDE